MSGSKSPLCTLKRCQGKRGCICPSGNIPVGAYAGRKLEPIVVAPASAEKVSASAVPTLTKGSTKASKVVGNKKLDPLPTGKVKGSSLENVETHAIDLKASSVLKSSASEDFEVDGVDGEVTIRYNHYKNKFKVTKGSTTTAAVDAEYYLSFAFPKCKIHLTLYGPSDFSFEAQGLVTRPLVREQPEGTYRGLDPTREYWVDIEEDASERKAYEERQDALAKESAAKRKEQELRGGDDDTNAIVKSKTESCSCIEGNPCLDRYACKDWANRYEVAKKNGWKGFQ